MATTMIGDLEFEENLKRFCSLEGLKEPLIFQKPSRTTPRQNENGLNIEIKDGEKRSFVYSEKSSEKEADDWFSGLNLDDIKILYVFGIGLGGYYEACKKWLHANPCRFLIFLEDDEEMLFHFLHSPLAKEILQDTQARVHFMRDWPSLIDQLSTVFLFDRYKLSASDYYKKKRFTTLDEISKELSHIIYSKQSRMGEFLNGSGPFYINYYYNLQVLSHSYFGDHLFGKFHGVPAIICGAGPSLEKNIETLKGLKERALIIAGGSAINAVNSYDLFPHLTVGIDPNAAQLTRVLANNAYETPFLYRSRIYKDALRVNNGPKCYLTGSGGYNTPAWFEEKLGIEPGATVMDEGYNVINFSVSIAKNLGCNPIILCGLDLAYTGGKSYAPAFKLHALHNFKKSFITKGSQDEPVGFKDIYGNPTTTLWKWLNEASWFRLFQAANPGYHFINATEGGIGFPNIENIPLKEVADKYLNKTYDLESMLHGEMENSHFDDNVNDANVLKKMKLLRKSLGKCELLLKDLLKKALHLVDRRLADQTFDIEPFLEGVAAADEKLRATDFYKAVLSGFANHYFWMFQKRMDYFIYDQEKESRDAKIMLRMQLEVDCCRFLQSAMQLNKCILEDTIKNYPQDKKLKRVREKKIKPQKEIAHSLKEEVSYYENGEIKTKQTIQEGFLEGFSYFFGKKGNLLAKSFYVKGKREGKAYFYYNKGHLFAIKNFKSGLLEGVQEFYYENGQKKALIGYAAEKLDGDVWLYYRDGSLKRELHFKNGKREGFERMWNAAGALIIEAFYKDDKPFGEANWWYDHGVLRQKSIHHEDIKNFNAQFFTPDGKEVFEPEDYFDKLVKITNSFTESIEGIFKQVNSLLPHLAGIDKTLMENAKVDLKALQDQMIKIVVLNQQIKDHFSGNAHTMEEPIWKSAVLQAKLDEQLNGLVEPMKKEIQAVQNLIQKEIHKLKLSKNVS